MTEQSETGTTGNHWERQTLQKVLLEHVREQRRARRWGIFFKLICIVFIGLILFNMFSRDLPQPVMTSKNHTALIDIYGEIEAEKDANADNIRDALQMAFENKYVKGVVLRINSPGGSPVQSRQIYDEIRSLRTQYPAIKIYAAIEDIGTSAAYLIASATDAIYSDKASLVGSIGVRLDSFGFVELIHKIGVERRLYTAGKHKGMLDPFLPRVPEDDAFIEKQLDLVHQVFINNVREGRGARLRETPEIFSGYFWSGEQALALGLTDGYGDAYYVAKEIIQAPDIVDYTPGVSLLDRIANRLGASIGKVFSQELANTAMKGIR